MSGLEDCILRIFAAMAMGSIVAKGPRMRSAVFHGTKHHTASGHKKSDLKKNKRGKIVTKASSAAGKKAYKNIAGWTSAVKKAKAALKLKGFVAVKKGTPLYKKAKEIYGT